MAANLGIDRWIIIIIIIKHGHFGIHIDGNLFAWLQDYYQAERTETAIETANFGPVRGDQFVSSVAQTIHHFRLPESVQQRRPNR